VRENGEESKRSSRVFLRLDMEVNVFSYVYEIGMSGYIDRSGTLYLVFWGSLRDMRLNYPPIEPNAIEVGEEEVEQRSSTIVRQVELSSSTIVS
jgi:hypothetical protein